VSHRSRKRARPARRATSSLTDASSIFPDSVPSTNNVATVPSRKVSAEVRSAAQGGR
jgi:hypothetical protein